MFTSYNGGGCQLSSGVKFVSILKLNMVWYQQKLSNLCTKHHRSYQTNTKASASDSFKNLHLISEKLSPFDFVQLFLFRHERTNCEERD